jgi:hypothetical protein
MSHHPAPARDRHSLTEGFMLDAGLAQLPARDGVKNVTDAVGVDA